MRLSLRRLSRYDDDDDDDDDDDGHDDPDDDFDETVDDDHSYTTTRRLLRYYTGAVLWGHQRRVEEGEGGMGGRQAVEPLWGWRTVKGGTGVTASGRTAVGWEGEGGREYGWGCKGGEGRGDLGPEAVVPLCVGRGMMFSVGAMINVKTQLRTTITMMTMLMLPMMIMI